MRSHTIGFLSAALVSVIPAQLFADSASSAFDGPYASLGLGYEINRVGTQNVSTASFGGLSFDQPNVSQAHGAAQVLAGYSYSFTPQIAQFSPKLNIAANIFHNFGNDEIGDITATFYSDKTQQKLSNTFGIAFEPGYYINDRTLAYGKVGYAKAEMEYNREDFAVSLNETLNGYLLGGGVKYLVTDNVYLGAEWTHYTYNESRRAADLSTVPVSVYSKVEQTVGLITIGYQF